MSGVRNLLVSIGEIIIVVLLAIFAVENIRYESYTFIGRTIPGNVWWTVAGSALLGFLFALLLLGPGRIAAAWRSRRLGRQGEQSGQQLAALRAEHERLQAEHAQVVSERDQYRSAFASTHQPSDTVVSSSTAAPATPDEMRTPGSLTIPIA